MENLYEFQTAKKDLCFSPGPHNNCHGVQTSYSRPDHRQIAIARPLMATGVRQTKKEFSHIFLERCTASLANTKNDIMDTDGGNRFLTTYRMVRVKRRLETIKGSAPPLSPLARWGVLALDIILPPTRSFCSFPFTPNEKIWCSKWPLIRGDVFALMRNDYKLKNI